MCDYSLHGLENRLAKEGEVLVVHRFHSGSKGLTSPDYLKPKERPKSFMAAIRRLFSPQLRVCAVCIPDGAELALSGIPLTFQHSRGVGSCENVTFRQLSANTGVYRDAVEFKNGMKVSLQELEEGQSMEVLALSSETLRRSPTTESESSLAQAA